MNFQPFIPLNLVLTEEEFDVLTEVGEENNLTPDAVVRAVIEEYLALRADHPFLYLQFAMFRDRSLK